LSTLGYGKNSVAREVAILCLYKILVGAVVIAAEYGRNDHSSILRDREEAKIT
jgi:hypothetical protein